MTQFEALLVFMGVLMAVFAGAYTYMYVAAQLPDERRIAKWVTLRLGADHMTRQERAVRLLEEAVELAQAEGIERSMVERLVAHVYSREPGTPEGELAGVAVTVLAYCAAVGLKFCPVALAEIERIEEVPGERIMASLRRKAAAGLLTVKYDATEVQR